MKKVIALVLALCMVFAMSTAAFAVTGKIQKLDSQDPYGARHEVAPEDAKTIIRTEGTEENDEYMLPFQLILRFRGMIRANKR